MPSDSHTHQHDYFHGLLNLEQQRRRAKDLLKALRSGQPDALDRLTAHAGITDPASDALRLADAQLVIARENGFASWPKLKAHCDRLQESRRQREAGRLTPPDTEDAVHLRCGSDIRHGLEIAGFRGRFVEFADPFCQGPVRDLPRDAFLAERAAFIASSYGYRMADALARGRQEYDALDTALAAQHLVLWFEHDSYDQLILAHVLAALAAKDPAERPARLELICVDSVPGVPGFTGLGQLAPDMLLWLWDNHRVPVGDAQLALGRDAWQVLTAEEPSGLVALATAGTPAIPPMARALRRHLQELPSGANGLSQTQGLVLRILADKGTCTGGQLFRELMTKYEELPYLGDLMFWHVLDDFVASTNPPVDVMEVEGEGGPDPDAGADPAPEWLRRRLALNGQGMALLAGEADYMMSYTGERWVGGLRVASPERGGVPFRWTMTEGRLALTRTGP